MREIFTFLDPGHLEDGDLQLVLVKKTPADPSKGYVPGYEFEMRRSGRSTMMGTVSLRIGSAVKLRYPGHIGYEVKKRYRGNRYAARSIALLLPLAAAHGLKAVWLTVDPHNIPSKRTCDILGAKFVETVRIPKTHQMYAEGARYRRRYRLRTDKGLSNKMNRLRPCKPRLRRGLQGASFTPLGILLPPQLVSRLHLDE